MRGMPALPIRTLALLSALAAGAVLGAALASEHWDGLVPCALCLLERWPYRVAIALSLVAIVVPPRLGRVLLMLVVLVVLADVGVAFVHVGVEAHWWPSPLPECAAPHFVAGTIAQRLASMPLRPAKPCDAADYLIPGLPLSLAAMNMLYAAAFVVLLSFFIWRASRRPA
ncbi:MAG TPA: disulfide bond formation protein B [Acetobacteraceae bacterium]|nr:disulfide bond formation protein B [Acetobacteraceae bacterium]